MYFNDVINNLIILEKPNVIIRNTFPGSHCLHLFLNRQLGIVILFLRREYLISSGTLISCWCCAIIRFV